MFLVPPPLSLECNDEYRYVVTIPTPKLLLTNHLCTHEKLPTQSDRISYEFLRPASGFQFSSRIILSQCSDGY